MKEPTLFMGSGTTIYDQIEVENTNFDLLVSKIYTAWRNVGNFKIAVVDFPLPGYIKFKIIYSPLGELGTFEVILDKDNYCIINFSPVTLIENYNDWLQQSWQEVQKTGQDRDERMLLLGRMLGQKMMAIDPELQQAKNQIWRETIDGYKFMIDDLKPRAKVEEAAHYIFRQEEDKFRLAFEDDPETTMDATKEGLNYIHRLLSHPFVEFPPITLQWGPSPHYGRRSVIAKDYGKGVSDIAGEETPRISKDDWNMPATKKVESGGGGVSTSYEKQKDPIWDSDAYLDLKTHIAMLEEEIAEKKQMQGETEKEELEKKTLEDNLLKLINYKIPGRSEIFPNQFRREMKNIVRQIDYAIDMIKHAGMPKMAAHLKENIEKKEGYFVYPKPTGRDDKRKVLKWIT